ncbi:GumC family protein [Roseisalinus antarcticus]|uniref:non-specific protein-tyrosine kinase n=1 Tax=Roseisalinus antarcticus TaxID=254357 RepID=A0A1Y5SJR7_9RHOB|nr:polysaccharide biosynthesis tyrosine autokinase [Roseisalinus antarcticus]SLN42025.1 Tyrosine-protein kinase ptk [Roseisalinus antarcticus]
MTKGFPAIRSIGPSNQAEAALPPSNGQSDGDTIDLVALLGTLWRGKWVIALLTTLTVLAGGYYAYVAATPMFRSTAVVILETEQANVTNLEGLTSGITGGTAELNSEVQILRARGLMGRVVDELDLITDPEFNEALNDPSGFRVLKERVRVLILGPRQPPPPRPIEEVEARIRDNVITSLLAHVAVRNVPQSYVFEVSVETESAQKSALIADTIVELYIVNQLDVKFEAMEQATSWLSDRVAELQVDLECAEAVRAEFSTSTDLVSPEALAGLERQLKDVRDRAEAASIAAASAEARLAAMRAAETPGAKAAAANDSQLSEFLPRVATSETIAQAFDTRFQQIIQRAELEAMRSEQQIEALQTSIAGLETQIATQGEDLIRLQQLTREAEAIRLLYEYFLNRLNETSAQQGIQEADSRILSDAVPPIAAFSPRKTLIVLGAALLGIIFGSLVILVREAMSTGFRTARSLEQDIGYPVIGQIPVIPARKRRRVVQYLSEKPTSAAAEAVRNLRTSLMLSNVDNPPKVIVSTSSIPGEGKTTNSLALAHNLVGMGRSVLIIEGDIRRRTFGIYFENLPKKGLVSLLSGEATLGEVIHTLPEFGADVLGGEGTKTNAADLFSSKRFAEFLLEMRGRYDNIIIDTPPALVVPDARIIAQVSDAVIFTVRWDSTSRSQVEEALRLFEVSNQAITGLVLSQISPKGMKRYGYGGRYGAYSSYGSKYYTS